MTLARQFQASLIRQINDKTYQLVITYCYYYLYNYEETFIFDTLEKAKTKLLSERCNYKILFEDEQGKEKNLNLL